MSIDKDTSLLFSLLRFALWHSKNEFPLELSEEESLRMLTSASKQAVTGLMADALIQNDVQMPQRCVFEIIGTLEQIKNQNKIVNQGVIELHNLMEEAGINYSVMKGQAVAVYYPETLYRQAGDIDYYCAPKDFDRSLAVVKEMWKVKPEIHGSEKHADYDYQGNRYEPHYILTDLHNKKNNTYLKKLVEDDLGAEVDIQGARVKTFSPTLHALYIFLHLYFHLVEVGVGLRQICDLAMILKEDVDVLLLRTYLESLGMRRAFAACSSILVDYLGMDAKYLPYEIDAKDRKYGRRMLGVILYRGNMGHYNKRNGWSGFGHQVESAFIKISHFVKFFWLSPGYHIGWIRDCFCRL